MTYNFDEIITRKGTNCVKWDDLQARWGRTDLLPMWVADMDFRTPPFIMNALRRRLEHEVLGYTFTPAEWYESVARWLQARHGLSVERSQMGIVRGIVRGIAFAVQCFTRPGDKVMVQPPVYHPFFLVSQANHRQVVYSPLSIGADGQMHIDFDRFSHDIQGCKMFILSNPHNPGGRVWNAGELRQIARICQENNTLVVSDEIHADLTLPPHRHQPYIAVCEEARNHSITFMAPSKAFNMPGLSSSYSLIANPELKQRFDAFMEASELNAGNMFACLACQAAYDHGAEWLDELLDYLNGNIDYTRQFLREHIPSIGMVRPQASYLVFLDCRRLQLPQPRLVELFVEKAGLALNDGTTFGKEGEGFMRLNVGCPRSVLHTALQQLRNAVEEIGKTNAI